MLASLQQALPQQWQDTLDLLATGFSWIPGVQHTMLTFALTGASVGELVAKGMFVLLPSALVIAAFWCTVACGYTLPFRSGRGVFLQAVALSWWDVIRMIGFYFGGVVRLGVVLVGWVLSLLKLGGALVVGFLKLLFLRPFALFDWLSRQYFKPGVPWLAFLFILIWSALEATIFTFTLRPTVTDVLADLTRTELSSWLVTVILWPFLFILISGSFAGIQALLDAFAAKTPSRIIGTSIFEASIMFFEVLFLYRELISAITPWIYQQTGVQIGFVGTLVMASFGWIGIRSMTWFLFGRFGTPALLGILARENIAGASGTGPAAAPLQPDFWRGPISALKSEAEWFKQEAREVFGLMLLPVLQLLAAAINFVLVVIRGRPEFKLPFKSLDEVLASTPFAGAKATVGGPA
jgi:hypothetical protein